MIRKLKQGAGIALMALADYFYLPTNGYIRFYIVVL
jgi:hypothetical protein